MKSIILSLMFLGTNVQVAQIQANPIVGTIPKELEIPKLKKAKKGSRVHPFAKFF